MANNFVTRWFNKVAKKIKYNRDKKRLQKEAEDSESPWARKIKKIGYSIFNTGRSNDFNTPEFDLQQVEDAYNTDGYIRQALDRYIELMFKSGWKVVPSSNKVKKYMNRRLMMLSDAMGKPISQFWKELSEA